MPSPEDYLNPSEKRERDQLKADRSELRLRSRAISAQLQTLYVRAKMRMAAAQASTGARL